MAKGGNTGEKIEKILTELATNTQVSKDILVQTTKTNGRVTDLEKRANGHDTIHAVDEHSRKRSNWWKDKIGTAAIGIVCAAIGFTALLILQKTRIVDVSSVSIEQYDSLPK